jgi:hypothetical protein
MKNHAPILVGEPCFFNFNLAQLRINIKYEQAFFSVWDWVIEVGQNDPATHPQKQQDAQHGQHGHNLAEF